MPKTKPTSDDYELMMRHVKDRVEALRSSPGYDPRKEREIDALYNQYIPPYVMQGNDSLIDIAERDAYINGIPPLGSQKKGGIVIKKAIRSAIGWYIQFVTQQISTFGSGVARVLRSMNHDIEELKKAVSSSENDFIYSLDLVPHSEKILEALIQEFTEVAGPIVVSDSLDSRTISALSSRVRIIVVDPNELTIEKIDSSIDVRKQTLQDFVSSGGSEKFSGAILSGRIQCIQPTVRYSLLKNLSLVCTPGSKISVIISINPSEEMQLAHEVMGSALWSESSWKKVLEFFCDGVVSQVVDNFVVLSGSTKTAG